MTIRNFKPADREAVLAMVYTFYASPGVLHPIPTAHFADAYDELCGGGSQLMRGLAIEVDSELAGYSVLSFTYSLEAGGLVVLLEEGFVKPEYRSHGLGTKLLEFLKAEYHGKAARLRLEVAPGNTRAIALYERLGFEELPYVQMILEDF